MVDTVIFDVASMPGFLARAQAAAQSGKPAQAAHISFPSTQRLLYVLNANRLAMLRTLSDAQQLGVRELARRLGRDVRAVHADIRVLLDAGVIERTGSHKLRFPYRRAWVQFAVNADEERVPPVDASSGRTRTRGANDGVQTGATALTMA